MISQKIKEIEREIEEYLKGKEMKATFENQEIATSIFGDLLYNKNDVINSIIFFYQQGKQEIKEMIEKVIDDYFNEFGDIDGIDTDYNVREELKQKLGVGK